MLNGALKQKSALFRPVKPSSPTETQTYVKATLERVKLASSSKGFRVSSSGETQKNSATLFYNIGWSKEDPALSPLFQAGDIITGETDCAEPPLKRFVVQDVTEHTFLGKTNHYEVVLA